MFAYCGNNPIIMTGPSGEFFSKIVAGAFVGDWLVLYVLMPQLGR